jgi:hypothetical protein
MKSPLPTPLEQKVTKAMTYSLIKENKSDEFDYIDQNGTSYDSPQQWLWSILGGCGCGSSDELAERAVKVLKLFTTEHMERSWSIYDDPTNEVIAHWMDSKGLIEHGTGIGGSWLTDKGKEIYEAIKKLEDL